MHDAVTELAAETAMEVYPARPRAGAPHVSIVIPTYHRPDLLARCLDAVLSQQGIDCFEVIVADDGPDRVTRDTVSGIAHRVPHTGRIVYLPVTGTQGPAAARNRGWRVACGKVVAFTDDDTIPDPHWLATGVAALEQGHALAVSGRVIVPLDARPTDYERDAAGLERAEFVTANCFVRRDALARTGGFDERFETAWREDSDLHFSLLALGGPVLRADGAVVIHPVRPAHWGVSLSQQRKVQFDALLFRKHPALYRQRVRAHPPWRYYTACALFLGAAVAALLAHRWLAAGLCAAWVALTLEFCLRRLRGTSHKVSHLLEMAVTSAAIPPLAVFWRLRGALRFRVPFA